MTAFAHDAWATAKTNGTAVAYAGNEAGNTRNSRIDYIWYSKNATQLVLKARAGVRHARLRRRDAVGSPAGHGDVPGRLGDHDRPRHGRRRPTSSRADFDGDAKADLSVYRPRTGEWFVSRSGGAGALQVVWGAPTLGDVPVAGDYDGDGRAGHRGVPAGRRRPGTSATSSTGARRSDQWGRRGDVPVPGDYDGDGRTDVAVFRPSTGTWYVRYCQHAAPTTRRSVGHCRRRAGARRLRRRRQDGYRGVPAVDRHVVRALLEHGQRRPAFQWGGGGDITVPGDYDGDGRTDVRGLPAVDRRLVRPVLAHRRHVGLQWGSGDRRPVAGRLRRRRQDRHGGVPSVDRRLVHALLEHRRGTAVVQWGNGERPADSAAADARSGGARVRERRVPRCTCGPSIFFHGANAFSHAFERRRQLRVVPLQHVQHRVLAM